MRLALVVVTAGAVLAGCAKSTPAPVSEDFKTAVNSLLTGSSATPTFDAVTCGSVLDAPGDDQVVMWSDAQVPGGSADKLLSAGIAAGWQPQRAAGFDLFLIGPNDVRFALRGTQVRAERAKCSISGRSQDLAVDVRPDLTAGQVDAMSEQFGPAAAAARAIHRTIGKPLDTKEFPESGKITDATGLSLSTCGEKGGPRGAGWNASVKHELAGSADPATLEQDIIDALPSGLQIDERPKQPGYFQASAAGVDLSVSIAPKKQPDGSPRVEFTLTMSADCTPVTGP
ncbi:MAG: hypothetical protein M3548_04670 [Actinomycetota bacterium]|nr:hypothetical protein [Actinomycetota bacterium]